MTWIPNPRPCRMMVSSSPPRPAPACRCVRTGPEIRRRQQHTGQRHPAGLAQRLKGRMAPSMPATDNRAGTSACNGLQDAEAELAVGLDRHRPGVRQYLLGVRLELDALLEVDQVSSSSSGPYIVVRPPMNVCSSVDLPEPGRPTSKAPAWSLSRSSRWPHPGHPSVRAARRPLMLLSPTTSLRHRPSSRPLPPTTRSGCPGLRLR